MRSITKQVLFVLAAFLVTAVPAAAQETEKLPPHIRTSGDAVVTVQPDRALIDIGVVTQSDTSKAAVTGNAEKAQRTIAALRQLLRNAATLNRKSEELLATTEALLARVQELLDRATRAGADGERPAASSRRSGPPRRDRRS